MNSTPAAHPLLSIQDLRFAHAGVPVFEGLCASLPAGVCLVSGDEGTGKSTLPRLLAGQLPAGQGRVQLGGRDLAPTDVAWFDPLDPSCDQRIAREILAELAPAAQGLDGLLEDLGLAPHLHKPLYQLSTGSRRKVFLAAALARQARLTLLDQPFVALDRPSVEVLSERFRAWADATDRLLLLADYVAPDGVPLAATLDLDRLG